jgi:hypothetical protein
MSNWPQIRVENKRLESSLSRQCKHLSRKLERLFKEEFPEDNEQVYQILQRLEQLGKE